MAPGVWGDPSSTIDWCEGNYEITRYIAEFWNTISNLSMIVPPLLSMLQLMKLGFEKKLIAWNTISNLSMIVPPLLSMLQLMKLGFEKKVIACHFSLLCVGIGSWCFHMTLLYSMQLLDELPMLWGAAFLIYAFIEVKSIPNQRNYLMMGVLFLYCTVATIVYLLCKTPIFFQACYGIEVFVLVFNAVYAVRTMENCDRNLVYRGCMFYGAGFLLWMCDNNICSTLTYLRLYLGPLAPLLEFHAWWHIGAGIGTYLGILFIAHTRCLVLKKPAQIKHILGVWPYLHVDSPILIR